MPTSVRASSTALRTTNRPPAIGFWMAVALVMGNMVGSGIFLLPASLASYGGASLLGWLVSTGGSVALALVFARLARRDPAGGGPYAYTRAAFGDFAGFLVAWGYWISIWASLGALAVACVGYLDPFIPAIVRTPSSAAVLAISIVWVLVIVNIAGVRAAGSVQVVTTVLKIIPLVAVGLAGLVYFEPSHFAISQSGTALAGSVTSAATLTLWAFLGLESATVPADSIDDPEVTIPRATVVGTLLTAVVYVASTVGAMSLLSTDVLLRSTAPFADAARALAGGTGAAVIALGAAVSCLGALNGWTLLAGQLPLAVARDGLFPEVFAKVSARGTPAAGIVIAGVLTSLLIAANYTRGLVSLFTFIILLCTLNTLVPYVFSSLALFMAGERSARERLTRGSAVIASIAFLYSLFAIGGAGTETVYWGFLLIMAGLPVYVWVARRRVAAATTRPATPV